MESDDVVNIENQTQESITFSVNTTVSTVTINKVKLMANNNVLAEYSENFENVTFNFIEESMEYGDNIISVQVEYTQGDGVSDVATCESNTIYRREVKLEEFQPFTDLHLNVSLEDIIYRINEVNEVHKAMASNLINILDSKGIVVNENSRLSELINLTVNLTNSNSQEITDYINQIAELEHQKNNLIAKLEGKVTPAGDAVASNVLSGKTFINSTGSTLTGTMANNGTKTITPKASAQTLGAGYYDKITINGDADLVAANIVSGKNIFGVTGTASTLKSSSNFNYAFFTNYNTTIYINNGASDTKQGQNYLITSFTNNAGDCNIRISGLTVHVSQYYNMAYTVEYVRNGSVVYTSTIDTVGSTKFSTDYDVLKKGDVLNFYIKSKSSSAKNSGVKDLMILGSLSV
jgi:hypothetical protein